MSSLVTGGSGSGGGSARGLLASQLLASPASSIELGSIPSGHTQLTIEAKLRSDVAAASDYVELLVGAGSIDSGANYDYSIARFGTTTSSPGGGDADTKIRSSPNLVGSTATAGNFTFYRIQVFNYAEAEHRLIDWQSLRVTNGNTIFERGNALWRNAAAAIDVVRFVPVDGSNFIAGSYVRVYGE